MEANTSKLVGGWEAERRSVRLRWPILSCCFLPAEGGRKGGAVFSRVGTFCANDQGIRRGLCLVSRLTEHSLPIRGGSHSELRPLKIPPPSDVAGHDQVSRSRQRLDAAEISFWFRFGGFARDGAGALAGHVDEFGVGGNVVEGGKKRGGFGNQFAPLPWRCGVCAAPFRIARSTRTRQSSRWACTFCGSRDTARSRCSSASAKFFCSSSTTPNT